MKHFTRSAIEELERFYRANLVNSVSGYKPANLIGTVSDSGVTNVAIFSSVVHLGADPALLAFIQRPVVGEQGHKWRSFDWSVLAFCCTTLYLRLVHSDAYTSGLQYHLSYHHHAVIVLHRINGSE